MTISEFDPNFPLPTTTYADWQIGMLANFLKMAQSFAVNHVPLTDPTIPSIAGNHTIVELVEQKNPQQTDAAEISVYSKLVPGQTDQIYINSQGTEVQYTMYQLYELPDINGQVEFFTFLPGNVIVFFGKTAAGVPNIKLYPSVARNIITVNITINNTLANPPTSLIDYPVVSYAASKTGIIDDIILKLPAGSNLTKIKSMFYIVLANF